MSFSAFSVVPSAAAILVLADFVAARALAPFQIPVGLVTGAIGGLYMLWLLNRQRH